MVRSLLLIASFWISFASFSQISLDLQEYSRFGLDVGFSIYEKGKTTNEYGSYTVTNSNSAGFNLGATYSFFRKENWRLKAGFIWSTEPDMNFTTSPYLEGDVLSGFENLTYGAQATLSSFTIPVIFQFHFPISKRLFGNVFGSVNTSYLPQLYSEGDVIIIDDNSKEQNIFSLVLITNGDQIRSSFSLGTGIDFEVIDLLTSLNISYTYNFNSKVNGYYVIDQLFISESSGGNYSFSGNYLRISLSVNISMK